MFISFLCTMRQKAGLTLKGFHSSESIEYGDALILAQSPTVVIFLSLYINIALDDLLLPMVLKVATCHTCHSLSATLLLWDKEVWALSL
jgi:hypothetical protein